MFIARIKSYANPQILGQIERDILVQLVYLYN